MPQISLSRLALLATIVFSVFFTQLGSARLWDRDEPRNSRASHEMLQRGDWIVPTFNGELRDHKPILLYWGQMAAYSLLGKTEWAARLPSALCSLLTILSVAFLATRLSGCSRGINRNGFWAAGVMATCLLFVMAGRAATPDACLIAFSTLGITSLVFASVTPALPYSSGNVGTARWIPAAWGYTMLGLAVLAKGPVGMILPLAVVHIWWLVGSQFQRLDRESETVDASRSHVAFRDRVQPAHLCSKGVALLGILWRTFHPWQWVRSIIALRTLPGVALCLLAALPWYCAVGVETNGEFLRGFFWEHNVGRAVSSMEGHGGSIFFYPVALLVGTFPWSLWLIPILLWASQSSRTSIPHRQMVTLASVWVTIYVAAFSIASTKLPSYITPCYAGVALVVGGFLREFESAWSIPTLNWRRLAYGITAVTGVAIVVAILWLSRAEAMPLLSRAAMAGGAIVSIAALGMLWERTGRLAWVPATWLVGAAAFQVMLFGFGAKSVDRYRSDLQLLTQVKKDAPSVHWLSIGGMEPSWVHYLDQEIIEVTESPLDENAWKAVQEFLEVYPDGHVIAVGDAAIQRADRWTQGDCTLTSLAQGQRFMKPGKLAVYRASQPDNIAAQDTSNAERVLTR